MQLRRSMLAVAAAALLAGCAGDDAPSPLPASPPLKVAIVRGGFYSDALFSALAADPEFTATTITDCEAPTLSRYDVIWIYGNACAEERSAVSRFVSAGGGVVATPWTLFFRRGFSALPVERSGGMDAEFSAALDVVVADAEDPIVRGVAFVAGDAVGYEPGEVSVKPGAVAPVRWDDRLDTPAVARWEDGDGRAVYLNFHYVTSDCDLATAHGWGRTLARNATLWAGGRL